MMFKIRKTKNVLLAAATACIILAIAAVVQSCSKSDDATPAPANAPGVYVAGQLNAKAVYWKDGQLVELTPQATHEAMGNAVVVSGTDVYVAGYEENGDVSIAKLWKKSGQGSVQELILSDLSHDGFATSVAVSKSGANTTIYVSGYEINEDNNTNVAKYWKITGDFIDNKVESVPLATDETFNSYTSSIAVSGTNIYVAGYANTANHSAAKLWKKDSQGVHETTFADADKDNFALSVTVSGTDAYVAGYEVDQDLNKSAKYWKNDQAGVVLVAEGSTGIQNFAYSVAVSGTDVYVAGTTADESSTPVAAKYWKKASGSGAAQEVVLSNGNGFLASSIFISGADIYVAGDKTGTGATAKYWKNNVAVALADGGIANSIVVY